MKPIKYEEYIDQDEFIRSLGNVLFYVEDQAYGGDTLILFWDKNDGVVKYGYLRFGWGTCSQCDALQGCRNQSDVDELQQQLYDSIQWFTRQELINFMENHDWEGSRDALPETIDRFKFMVDAYFKDMLEGVNMDNPISPIPDITSVESKPATFSQETFNTVPKHLEEEFRVLNERIKQKGETIIPAMGENNMEVNVQNVAQDPRRATDTNPDPEPIIEEVTESPIDGVSVFAYQAVCKNRDDLLDQNKAIMAKCRELERQNQTLQINFNRKNEAYNNQYAQVNDQESQIEFLLCEVELLTRRLAEKHAQTERLSLHSKDFDDDRDDDMAEM